MSDFTDENKPRERLNRQGPSALSDQELLAILLGSGTKDMNVIDLSSHILSRSGGLNGLRKISAEELNEIPGIGPAKAASILASIELGKRFSQAILKNEDRWRINTAEDVYNFLRYEMENLTREELHVLSLDNKHNLLSNDILYVGTINTSNIRIAEIFRRPLLLNAAAFILAHNHPSGDPTPSAADIVTTRNVMAAGKAMELPILDHIVIGSGRYVSIKAFLD